jgi:hypothetical protein
MKKNLLIILLILPVIGISQEVDNLLDSARIELGKMHYSIALKKIKQAKPKTKEQEIEIAYLKAEAYLILGRDEFETQIYILDSLEAEELIDILKLKHTLFIGSNRFDSLVKKTIKKYPNNSEIAFCNWLLKLDNGEYNYCKKAAPGFSKDILFHFAPYLALYYAAWDRNYKDALLYLDTMEMITGKFHQSKYRKLLELNSSLKPKSLSTARIELPFAKCGPGIGLLLEDSNGDTIKMELDTGTGHGWMTIHDSTTGNNLPGTDTLSIKDGIWYNYMSKPEDFKFKLTNFKNPACENVLVGYFNGRFTKADGCFSPFFFKERALQFDPINQKVYLHTEESLQQYKRQNKSKITIVPYALRNGWVFIPCEINGQEVMMMVETGSRDVNFNNISAKMLGLKIYDGFIKWRDKDYPMKKVDCTIKVGRNIHYDVKGGLISEFVLGNNYYGLASAGDLGPEFFKNYIFTIDIFNKELILEQP